jgi:hypothetical protein
MWRVEYHYQDGREVSRPMSKAEAVKQVTERSDKSGMYTLIGPDGQIYKV